MGRQYFCQKHLEISQTDEWTLIDFPDHRVQLSFPNPKEETFGGYHLYATGSERIEKLTLVVGHRDLEVEFVSRYDRSLKDIYYWCNGPYVNFPITQEQMRDIYKFFGHPEPEKAVGEGFEPRKLPIVQQEEGREAPCAHAVAPERTVCSQ